MLTFRYLLTVVAAVVATAAVAAAVLGMFSSSQAPLVSAAASIVAEKAAHLDTPVAVRLYPANYTYTNGRWVLTDRVSPGATAVPVYVLGLGQCPQSIQGLLGKTYTQGNATVVLTNCVLVMPWVQGSTITHYAATCRSGTDFKLETAEVEASGVKVRLVVVNC
jgi:FlaG/FlaF family flagellin (archaellin)